MPTPRLALLIAVLAVPLLAGAQCAFIFSSGGGSSDREEDDERKGLTVIVVQGRFTGGEGVGYSSGRLRGVTGRGGSFEYEAGSTVQFSIGDIDLGSAVPGKAVVGPRDLAADGDPLGAEAVNIARLLHSLDADRQDEEITIPESVRKAAVLSNGSLAAAIEYLDFSDDAAFANAASQLVAVLTDDYPFTAMLVDGETVREGIARLPGPDAGALPVADGEDLDSDP